jgi:uridine kinase
MLRAVWEEDCRFDREAEQIALELLEIPELHFIGLTGPTCSGKTTAAKKLTETLGAHGKRLHVISLDDFYFEKKYLHDLAHKKGLERLDYDSEETIDIALFAKCAENLLAGRETVLPRFNFRTGDREVGETIKPTDGDLFLFEGIQILYPKVRAILEGKAYRSIYIAPLSALETDGCTVEPNELRLMRRLVRDYHFRNTTPEFTFYLWQGVRENEDVNIFPFVSLCHFRLNSTMRYELGILKGELEKIFKAEPVGGEHAAHAERILNILKNVELVPSIYISENSIYKEFV